MSNFVYLAACTDMSLIDVPPALCSYSVLIMALGVLDALVLAPARHGTPAEVLLLLLLSKGHASAFMALMVWGSGFRVPGFGFRGVFLFFLSCCFGVTVERVVYVGIRV